MDRIGVFVLTDSLSLCNEALMRSGLRGGGSGGSEAAIVGPVLVPFICIIFQQQKFILNFTLSPFFFASPATFVSFNRKILN